MVYSSGRICWLESTSLLSKLDIDSAIMVVLATFSGVGQSAWQELLEAGQVLAHRVRAQSIVGGKAGWQEPEAAGLLMSSIRK